MRKAWAIARSAFMSRVAYRFEMLGRVAFLLLILFVLRALYAKVLPPGSALAGFDAGAVLWYLVLTEAILIGCPRFEAVIDEEVKSGKLASFLLRPVSYVGYHRWRYLGEAAANFPVNLAAGGALALLLVGAPPVGAPGVLVGAAAVVLGMLVNFQLSMTLALTAFWVEDSTPFFWVYQKLLFILGGLMIPLEFMPDWMRELAAALPFSLILHGPARVALAYDPATAQALLARQLLWLLGLGLLTAGVFRLGERKVSLLGG